MRKPTPYSNTNTQTPATTPKRRCAVYTRKSTDEGLDMEYNSLEAQRDAGLAYIASQRHEGWIAVADGYDDGGFSGGNMERPALRRLMADIGQFWEDARTAADQPPDPAEPEPESEVEEQEPAMATSF